MTQDYNKHFLDKNGKFSAEKFWENMESEGDRVTCDETHPNFWQRDEEIPEFYDEIKFKRSWQSVLKIKRMHNAASNKAVKDGLYRINQRWMSETLFGFMGLALSRPDRFGLGAATHEELSSLVHFWRVIGWMMGIEDRFNICRETLDETRSLCNMFIDKYLRKWIYIRDPSSYKLQMSLIEGMATVVPVDLELTYNSVLELIERPSEKNLHLFFKTDRIQETSSYLFRALLKQLEITGFRRFINVHTEYLLQGLMEDEMTDRIFAGQTAFIMFP